MRKTVQFHARIRESDQVLMDQTMVGDTAVAAIGLNTIRLCTQRDARFTCTYLSKTGEAAPRPAAAPGGSLEASAHGCPCPACPIAQHFQTVPHKPLAQKKNDPAEHEPLAAADHKTVGSGGCFELVPVPGWSEK